MRQCNNNNRYVKLYDLLVVAFTLISIDLFTLDNEKKTIRTHTHCSHCKRQYTYEHITQYRICCQNSQELLIASYLVIAFFVSILAVLAAKLFLCYWNRVNKQVTKKQKHKSIYEPTLISFRCNTLSQYIVKTVKEMKQHKLCQFIGWIKFRNLYFYFIVYFYGFLHQRIYEFGSFKLYGSDVFFCLFALNNCNAR